MKKNWVMLAPFLLLESSTLSHARNGFIPHYVGIEGMIGGAGTACPLDATSVVANPAALARVSNHVLLTLGFIGQNQHVDTAPMGFPGNAVGKQTNLYKTIPVATLGFNYIINSKWMIGFASTGGGGFVRFKEPVVNPAILNPSPSYFNRHTVNAVTLSTPTLAYKPADWHGYGISLLIATSRFKSDLAIPEAGNTEVTGKLQPNMILGMGTRIGGIWDLHKDLTMGISAATPVYGQRHNKYKQLFKDKFEIPATFRFGLTWRGIPRTEVSADFKVLFYGESKWVHKGQGWNNQPIFLAGVLHHLTDELTLGLGYNYAKMPIKKNNVIKNALSIPLDEHHLSGGAKYKFCNNKIELFGMGYYIPKKKAVDNGETLAFAKGAKIDSTSWGGELGVKYNF